MAPPLMSREDRLSREIAQEGTVSGDSSGLRTLQSPRCSAGMTSLTSIAADAADLLYTSTCSL